MMFCSLLAERAILRVAGEAARDFLQGLVSCDMNHVREGCAQWGAFLTPQGRMAHEFFIMKRGDSFLLEGDRDLRDGLMKSLMMRRLRLPVEIAPMNEGVAVLWGGQDELGIGKQTQKNEHDILFYKDARASGLGMRVVAAEENLKRVSALSLWGEVRDASYYRAFLYERGLLAGARDYEVGKSLPLHYGMDLWGAVSFEKGCYMGQEVSARMHHRGGVKKKVMAVRCEQQEWTDKQAQQMRGRALYDEDGEAVALICAFAHQWGLALCAHTLKVQDVTDEKGRHFSLREPLVS